MDQEDRRREIDRDGYITIGDIGRVDGDGFLQAQALAASALRHNPDVMCLSVTMPAVSVQMMDSISMVTTACPTAQFVVGGRGLTRAVRSEPGVGICERVSEVVEAVDASVMRAGLD